MSLLEYPVMSTGYEITPITTTAAFTALRGEWSTLLAEADATPFQSWEWLHAAWRHQGRGRLWLLALREGGRLRGLAPLTIGRYFGTPFRRLGFLGTGATDFNRFILPSDIAAEGAGQFLAYIAEHRRRWDMCDFQQLPEASPLATAEIPSDLQGIRFVQERCPYVELPPTWDEYTTALGKKMRGNLGYYRRLLDREFEAEFFTADEATLPEAMEALYQLHQQRWNQRLLPGAFVGQAARRFHLDIAQGFLARGWLRLHCLRLNGTIKAALYCFRYGHTGYYYLGGFDPSLGRYSLGTLLTGYAIRDAIEAGCRVFDFLRGDEPYKYTWGAHDRENLRWLWWKPSWPSRLAPRLNGWERQAEHAIKAWARSR